MHAFVTINDNEIRETYLIVVTYANDVVVCG